MRPKGIEDFAALSAREVKRAVAEERKRQVFLCRGTVGVKVGDKAIPASFLKIEGTGSSERKTGEGRADRRIGRWSEPRS